MRLDDAELTPKEKKLRDIYAGKAMSALLRDKTLRECDDAFFEQIARDSFGYANEMILARRTTAGRFGPFR